MAYLRERLDQFAKVLKNYILWSTHSFLQWSVLLFLEI